MSITTDEFETRFAFHKDAMHRTFLADDGSIAALENNVRIIAAALNFIAAASTLADEAGDAELAEQCEVMGMGLGGLLVKNTTRLINARQAELELEMLEMAKSTIH